MTNNNSLVIGLLGEQFNLEIMVPQRFKEPPKTPKGLLVLLPVSILETKNNTEDRGSMDSTVGLKKTVIQKYQIPYQHGCSLRPPQKLNMKT